MSDFLDEIKELNEYFNPNDPSNVKQHWERHQKDFPEFDNEKDYEKRADEIAMKLPRGLIGTDDEVWSYIENIHNENRRVSYLPKTTEFVSFSQTGTPDKFGKLYRSQIRDYSFHKESLSKFKKSIDWYFEEDNLNAIMKCVKNQDFEKLYKHKQFLADCGVDTTFLEKYFPENWLLAKSVEALNKKFGN